MKLVNLFEICSPKQWKTISGNEILKNGKYPVYGANGIIGYYNEYNHEHETLLITCRGATCGTLNISVPKSYVNGNAMALDDISDKVDLKFLYYSLLVRGFNDVISGSAQPQITREGLQKVYINLCQLSTQKAIADKLDKADALRKKDKELLAQYDELAQAIFIDMFGDPVKNEKGWKTHKAKTIFNFSSGKFNPTKNLDASYAFPTYGGNGITGFSSSFLIDFPTIVIGRVGAYCGSIHITDEKSWITDNAIYIKRIPKEVNLVFLYFFLRNYKLNRFADYSGQPKITQKPLEDIDFFIVDINLQNQFAEKIQNIEAQKAIVKQQAQQSEELFQALLQESFNFNHTQHEKPQTALSGA